MSSHSRYQKFFADYFKDSWLNFDGFEDYFTNVICNLTSDKFSREKEKWEEEETRLLNEQKTLAFKHYQSFVSTAECSNDIRQSFDGLEEKLATVIDTVPELQGTLEQCTKLAAQSNKLRKEANISISKHPQLLEILELPQLIDTSIRNSFFEEGLELHSFVNNIALKYSDIPIIQMIKQDSDMCIRHMEDVLLKQLQGQISLALCLKSVGLLRRIGTYTDTQLKVKFLEVRTEWFRGIIDNVNKDEIQYYMCKMIDSYRVNLFDIITQYRSVFIEDKTTSLIFNSWLHKQIGYFLTLLRTNLPRCNGPVLDSTLAQSMYFGMSLGRVGADFRGALVPIFQQKILEVTMKGVERATSRFQRGCEGLLDTSLHGQTTLVNFLPLAVYSNSITTVLNELRHCAPVTICLHVVGALQDSLLKVVEATVSTVREHAKLAERVCTSIALELLPVLDAAVKTLFKTLPEIYNNRAFSNHTYLDKKHLSLDLSTLRAPLQPYLSSATLILLSEQPFETQLESETPLESGEKKMEVVGEAPITEKLEESQRDEGQMTGHIQGTGHESSEGVAQNGQVAQDMGSRDAEALLSGGIEGGSSPGGEVGERDNNVESEGSSNVGTAADTGIVREAETGNTRETETGNTRESEPLGETETKEEETKTEEETLHSRNVHLSELTDNITPDEQGTGSRDADSGKNKELPGLEIDGGIL